MFDLIIYNQESSNRCQCKNLDDLRNNIDNEKNNWININDLDDKLQINELCNYFDLHPLLHQDIYDFDHRPKSEDYEDYIFYSINMLKSINTDNLIEKEHVSMILHKNLLISFQEIEGDLFNSIRERIITGKGRVRNLGCDYLLYLLIDVIVDEYSMILDEIRDRIQKTEEVIIENSIKIKVSEIIRFRKTLNFIRKSVYPLRESIERLLKNDTDLIQRVSKLYLSNVRSNILHMISEIEIMSETAKGLMALYQVKLSNGMNNVMKILTIIATIFIPLTFVAGIYGMNFKFMPELSWKWGYPIVLGVMFLIGLIMILLMKKRKWF